MDMPNNSPTDSGRDEQGAEILRRNLLMNAVVTSKERGTASPEGTGVEWLRCAGERTAFILCVVSNLLVIALAIAVVLAGTEWLASHPFLERHIDVIRTILIAALFALPAASVNRNTRRAIACNDGLRVGDNQFPELYTRFLGACRKLGIEQVPELYVSREIERSAVPYTAWNGRSVIVLNAELMKEHWIDGLDWLTFAIAGALGAIRLGHTRWWVELLTVYSRRIPGLRTPVLIKETHSRDRCAAFVVPEGIRGLLVEVVGKDAVGTVDIRAFVEQTDEPGRPIWDLIAGLERHRPPLLKRARMLYESGLFDRARDRNRHSLVPSSAAKIVR